MHLGIGKQLDQKTAVWCCATFGPHGVQMWRCVIYRVLDKNKQSFYSKAGKQPQHFVIVFAALTVFTRLLAALDCKSPLIVSRM